MKRILMGMVFDFICGMGAKQVPAAEGENRVMGKRDNFHDLGPDANLG